MAAELIEVTGMVLTASPVKEYDKRIELLTKERGRISAFVTGARRVNSAVSACAIPFTFGTYRLYEGRSSYNVQSAQIKKFFAGIADDFEEVQGQVTEWQDTSRNQQSEAKRLLERDCRYMWY